MSGNNRLLTIGLIVLLGIGLALAIVAGSAGAGVRHQHRGGAEYIHGTSHADRISGGKGADWLWGGRGNDRLGGGPGNDRIFGESGRDRLIGGSGRDRISGGAGNDRIYVRGGGRDRVDCGAGNDLVFADRSDRLRRCERVRPSNPSSKSHQQAGVPTLPPTQGGSDSTQEESPAPRPNILLIVTDDQRYDTVTPEFMPNVTRELVNQGLSFNNAYVTRSLCCPSRTSILTGQYSHNTGVKTNWYDRNGDDEVHGGFESFRDGSTLATWLHDTGYRTGLVGKYLNQYGQDGDGTQRGKNRYVPPGWDAFRVFTDDDPAYYDYSLSLDGREVRSYGRKSGDYSTTVLADQAVQFIREGSGLGDKRPFFLEFTPNAPHLPAVPAPADKGKCQDFNYRPPSFNEPDVSDKPGWFREAQSREQLNNDAVPTIDKNRRNQVCTLLGIDRGVEQLIDELRRDGKLDNTLIIYTSDNGYMWGEHRLEGKLAAYQESVRVPLAVRGPGVRAGTTDLIGANIDFAPTIAEFAHAQPTSAIDGRSLVPLFQGYVSNWRNDILVEHWNSVRVKHQMPTFKALHTLDYSYVEYDNDERELYDLGKDPFELENVASSADPKLIAQLSARLSKLGNCVGDGCR